MNIRLITLLCLAGSAAAVADSSPQVALYYSFDSPPPPAVFAQIQTELGRILDATDLQVKWREMGASSYEEPGAIYVMRFHGSCRAPMLGSLKGLGSLGPDERSLAETSVSDGKVLPFADVWCNRVQKYLGVRVGGDVAMGRALARVAAHELFHMMSSSTAHAGNGIACAEYSREDLTARRFLFGRGETEWLRTWAGSRNAIRPTPVPSATLASAALLPAGSDDHSDTER